MKIKNKLCFSELVYLAEQGQNVSHHPRPDLTHQDLQICITICFIKPNSRVNKFTS